MVFERRFSPEPRYETHRNQLLTGVDIRKSLFKPSTRDRNNVWSGQKPNFLSQLIAKLFYTTEIR